MGNLEKKIFSGIREADTNLPRESLWWPVNMATLQKQKLHLDICFNQNK
jgi:hypothetical protein